MTDVEIAIARVDAATAEMRAALDGLTRVWNRAGRGMPPLTPTEIRACRQAGNRARRSAR